MRKLHLDVPFSPDGEGFISYPSNRLTVAFSDGTEKLCSIGHRYVAEEVTLPDGRRSTVRVAKLWLRVLDEAPAPVAPAAPKAAKAKAPKAKAPAPADPAPAPAAADPMAQLTTLLGSLLTRVEALEAGKR